MESLIDALLKKSSIKKLITVGDQTAENMKIEMDKLSKKELIDLTGDFIGRFLSQGEQIKDSVFLEDPSEEELYKNKIIGETLIKYYTLFNQSLIDLIKEK